MYFLMIASSLVFIYFGSKIVFIEDITKLLPQEGHDHSAGGCRG